MKIINPSRSVLKNTIILIFLLITTGCTAGTRTPISEIDIQDAAPYGIKGVRVWGDELGNQQIDTVLRRQVSIMKNIYADAIASGEPIHQTFLALSGGGPDGAFGAGLLAGWTKRGDRPEFDVVTGVSTGAIVGLFAFLGPEFDQNLQEIYTEYKTDQLIEPTIFSALTGGTSITDATGYNTLIDKYIDDNVVALIAEEARKGRLLLIGTTNLDAARPVVWNVTNIAASGHPNAKALIRDLVRASSAIPAVFPPILIPSVTAAGENVDELHVDGGATAQVMLFSPEVPLAKIDQQIGTEVSRELFVIMNNSLRKPYEPVDYGLLPIAGRAASSLISGSSGGDLYKIYAIAQRDNIDFNLTWIPDDLGLVPTEAFDTVYMEALYDYGFSRGASDIGWQKGPPNFVIETK